METTNIRITKEEFQRTLLGFHGTEQYHRHTLPNGMSLLITDGLEFVRENAGEGAYWLFDLILSWQLKLHRHPFQVWKLQQQKNDSWLIKCTDGNDTILATQEIPYSDFPIDSIDIWLTDGVALLPSEY
jgi:hypothetical protein